MGIGQVVGGIITVSVNGERLQARGNWSFNLGLPMREPVVGADGIHGVKTTPQIGFIEGAITLNPGQSMTDLLGLTGATVTLEFASRTIAATDAYFSGPGSASTDEGEMAVRFEGTFKEQ